MLVLRALVRDGVVPLLGPPTSIGDVHHGALYYYLLAPGRVPDRRRLAAGGRGARSRSPGSPRSLVTWWLARSIGGPVAGLVAGLAMAVSASAVDESTFIWNPNLIALSSAVALAGAWRAWTTRDPRWWLLAGVGTAVTMQCHVLGVTMLPIVGALLVADARSRTGGAERGAVLALRARRVWRSSSLALRAAGDPRADHELLRDQRRARLHPLRRRSRPLSARSARFLVIGARVVSWPLTGLFTDARARRRCSPRWS